MAIKHLMLKAETSDAAYNLFSTHHEVFMKYVLKLSYFRYIIKANFCLFHRNGIK